MDNAHIRVPIGVALGRPNTGATTCREGSGCTPFYSAVHSTSDAYPLSGVPGSLRILCLRCLCFRYARPGRLRVCLRRQQWFVKAQGLVSYNAARPSDVKAVITILASYPPPSVAWYGTTRQLCSTPISVIGTAAPENDVNHHCSWCQ